MKYTLDEARKIIEDEKSAESRKIHTCCNRLKMIFPSGQLPFIDGNSLLYFVYENRKLIVNVLKDYTDA